MADLETAYRQERGMEMCKSCVLLLEGIRAIACDRIPRRYFVCFSLLQIFSVTSLTNLQVKIRAFIVVSLCNYVCRSQP